MKMLSAVIPTDHFRALTRIAERRGITRSELVRAAVELVLRADADDLREQRRAERAS